MLGDSASGSPSSRFGRVPGAPNHWRAGSKSRATSIRGSRLDGWPLWVAAVWCCFGSCSISMRWGVSSNRWSRAARTQLICRSRHRHSMCVLGPIAGKSPMLRAQPTGTADIQNLHAIIVVLLVRALWTRVGYICQIVRIIKYRHAHGTCSCNWLRFGRCRRGCYGGCIAASANRRTDRSERGSRSVNQAVMSATPSLSMITSRHRRQPFDDYSTNIQGT